MDYNPQGNSITERIHQVLGNQLRTFELEERELTEEGQTFEPFLTACADAILLLLFELPFHPCSPP